MALVQSDFLRLDIQRRIGSSVFFHKSLTRAKSKITSLSNMPRVEIFAQTGAVADILKLMEN